jgi:hypothetical protein
MAEIKQLSAFYQAIAEDKRIGSAHISIYMALFQNWNINQFRQPVSITRQEIMTAAKISGRATYHKCMNELQEFGYIKYIPLCNPFLKSLVYFLCERVIVKNESEEKEVDVTDR